MIRVESLCVSFGRFKLRDISLEVPASTSLAILGPSGAGKTLLLESVLGVKRPERGRVFLDGRDVTFLPPEERGVSYVPQDLALFPHLSVRDNILFGLRARGRKVVEDAELSRVVELLAIGRLLDRRDIGNLSGGEKQRVALARALIVRPKVLFLDESFSALDGYIRRQLQEQLWELKRSLGLTLFQVTHDQEEAFLLGDQIAVVMEGRLEQVGPAEELHARPLNLRVARFLLTRNLLCARYRGREGEYGVVAIDGVDIRLLPAPHASGIDCYIGIRPEEVVLIRPGRPVKESQRVNLFRSRVESVVNLGHRRLLRLRVAGGLSFDCALSPRAAREIAVRESDEVAVHLRPESILFFSDQ